MSLDNVQGFNSFTQSPGMPRFFRNYALKGISLRVCKARAICFEINESFPGELFLRRSLIPREEFTLPFSLRRIF